MLDLSLASAEMVTAQPLPSSPRRFSTGTCTSVKNTSAKFASPAMFSMGRTSMPGESMGTSRQVMPSCLRSTSNSVRVSRMIQSAHGSTGGPDLLTVHHVVVADAFRLGLDGREVAAVVGLGVARAPIHLAVEDVRNEALLLFIGAVLDEFQDLPKRVP